MLHNGYMYVIETGDHNKPATTTPTVTAEKSGTPSYAVIAGAGAANSEKTPQPPRFVPVAANMPDGVDVERMHPDQYVPYATQESASEDQSETNSTDTKTPAAPSTTAAASLKLTANKNKQDENNSKDNNNQNNNKSENNNSATKNNSSTQKLPQEQTSSNVYQQHAFNKTHQSHQQQHHQQQQNQQQQQHQPATHTMIAPPPHHYLTPAPPQMVPANVPVVYMMPAPGQYHPGQPPMAMQAYAPQHQMAPWQMHAAPQHHQPYMQIQAPYQPAPGNYNGGYEQFHQHVTGSHQSAGPPPGYPPQKYHGYKRNSVNYDHTFNPLKSNGGPQGPHARGHHHHGHHNGHHQGHHHHHPHGGFHGFRPHNNNKDKVKDDHKKKDAKKDSKDELPKKTKSLQSTSTDNKNSTTSRSNSSNSDLSLGCSASQNGSSQRHSRSCSHDSGVSHKTPQDSNPTSSNHSQTGSCDGKASITATVNGGRCDSHESTKSSSRRFSNNGEFKKPDEELVKKIIDLIEFYLSDEYLAKDKYLLRQIRCKSEGYISIKLMTSFKKVKKLTRDWRTVRYALLRSKGLEISPEGFRVKRAVALPDALRKPRLLSSVVSIRLPLEYQSVDAITNMFSKYGEIGLVRLLKPGKEIPSDLRNYATQVPDIGKSLCAVVDFEQSEAALQAVRCLKEKLVDCGMRLALLGPRVRRTLYKQDRNDGDTNSTRSDGTCSCEKNVELCEIHGVNSSSVSKSEKTTSRDGTTTTTEENLRIDSNEHSSTSKTTSHDDCEHGDDDDDEHNDHEDEVVTEVEKELRKVEEKVIDETAPIVASTVDSKLSTVVEETGEELVAKNTSFDSGNGCADGVVSGASSIEEKNQSGEIVKIKSKVSIILREPKCPPSSVTTAGFTRSRKVDE